MTSRRKQEENHLKILKERLAQPSNKKCLECDQRGPTYVDVTIGSFVCTSCGGILRGLNPPHRVKSISMTTFTSAEISFIESRGNEWCRAVYLAKYDDQSRAKPESRSDHTGLKHFMELKYEQKRWYESPSQRRKLMESAAAVSAKNNKENVSASPPVKPLKSLLGESVHTVQIPSAKKDITKGIAQKAGKPSADLLGSITGELVFPSSETVPAQTAKATESGFSSGFADFDSAFGGFASSEVSSGSKSFAAFDQVTTQPMPFTTNTNGQTSTLGKKIDPVYNNAADKYAALADLDLIFHQNEPQNLDKQNEFTWSSPAKPVQPNATLMQPSHMTFGVAAQPQQNMLFTSVPMSTVNAAHSPWTSAQNAWNTPFQEQLVSNQSGIGSSNPFFAQLPTNNMQAGAIEMDYEPWTQHQHQMPARTTNNVAMSSTNPFNVPTVAEQQGLFNQPQSIRPSNNKLSNPFMF